MTTLTRLVATATAALLCTGIATATPATVRIALAASAPSLTDAAGWESAAHTALSWNITDDRTATDKTDVALLTDKAALYVRFTVHQASPVIATQTVDGAGEGTDDDVTVRLLPTGADGTIYSFRANPRGAHYQGASDHDGYMPAWTSGGRTIPDGYVVTMRIPFAALPNARTTGWRAQFERDDRTTGKRDVWTHTTGDANYLDAASVGSLVTPAWR